MDNNTDNGIQHLIDELLRPLSSGFPTNSNRAPNYNMPNYFPNYREPSNVRNAAYNDNMQIFQALRDIMVMYNSNISEYNSNITTSLQLLRLILEERNPPHPIYRNQTNQVPETTPVENLDLSNNRFSEDAFAALPTTSSRSEQDTFQSPRRPTRNNDHLFSYMLYRPTIRSEDAVALRRFFQNIIVRPTPEQIESATTLVPFHISEENVNNSCPITMEEFQEGEMVRQIRHCRHQFQEEPIQNWFRSNVRCPVCRYDIRDYQVESGSRPDTTTEPSPEPSQPVNALPGYHELLQEITHNFATDINNIISESFQTNGENGSIDVSQNFVFDFHVETTV